MHDVIIVGGGPAGLQAALTLGRIHRSVLLLDSGRYRNESVAHLHNFLSHDGTPPATFRAEARADLDAYADVEVCDDTVLRIERADDGFDAHLESGATVRGRKVILATGVRDNLPDVPGLDALWGELAYGCPFCHGHELSHRPIGILAAGLPAVHLTSLLRRIGSSITIFGNAADFTDEEVAALEAAEASVRRAGVLSVERGGPAGSGDDGVVLHLAAGEGQHPESVAVAGLFVGSGTFSQRAPFADQLGLTLLHSGCIEIDDFGKTSLPGVFAAGDLAHRTSQPMPMASVLAASAAGQVAAAGSIQELLADGK